MEKVSDWSVYDLLDKFTVWQAAFLWLEWKPSHQEHIPAEVSIMENALINEVEKLRPGDEKYEQCFGIPSGLKVSRQELINFAIEKGRKPKFLFPEERENTSSKDALDSRQRNTYLKLIKAFLKKLDINLEDRGASAQVKSLVELVGLNLSEDTIRKVLKEVKEID